MAALRVRRLDLTRRRATIAESATLVQGKWLVWGTPRLTSAGRFRYRGSSSTSWPPTSQMGPDDLVFAGVGRSSPPDLPPWWLRAAATAIGIIGLHPHGLRHTAASLAIASGADVKVAQQMLGNSSAAMTMDVYGHLYQDRLDEVADALDGPRSGPAGSHCRCQRC